MEMTGEQLIPVPQSVVWDGLNDPEILKVSIPGCDSIEKVDDTNYKLAITAAIGPVKAKFTGKLVLSGLNPPNGYSLAFEGSGGAAGFAKGSAQVALSTEGAHTRLKYSTKANVGGKLAQVGARLIDGVAAKLAEEFFVRFNESLAPKAVSAPAKEAPPAAPAFNPMWLVAGTIAVMLLASWLTAAPK